jgi:hypothetical protein
MVFPRNVSCKKNIHIKEGANIQNYPG